MKKLHLFFCTMILCLFSLVSAVSAKPLTENSTGLTVNAPKKFTIKYNGDGSYTLKKKRSKTKANIILGRSPFDAEGTADDFISSSGMKVKKYQKQGDSVLLKGKLNKKQATIRFRPVGEDMEIIRYYGKNKKKKNKKRRRSRRTAPYATAALTPGELVLLDRIVRSRQGGTVVPLPITIPTRQLTGPDGTSALIPDLPGWQGAANDGIISAGHPTQGIANLGVPTLVGAPNSFFQGVRNRAVNSGQAVVEIWPKQVQLVDPNATVQVLSVQLIPNTIGWLGSGFDSAMYAVRFNHVGLTWQAMFVSGVAPIDSFSYLWYHSYIAVPVGASPHFANALMNTWATWNNSNANVQRFQEALNTIRTTPFPGAIDQGVFDAIHQMWVDYIRGPNPL